jgi:hypothetical protein
VVKIAKNFGHIIAGPLKTPNFRRKLAKIAKNFGHNIAAPLKTGGRCYESKKYPLKVLEKMLTHF